MIPDDGFTARVLASLPPPAPQLLPPPPALAWSRPIAVLLGAVAGVALVWANGAGPVLPTVERLCAELAEPKISGPMLFVAACLGVLYVPALRRLWT